MAGNSYSATQTEEDMLVRLMHGFMPRLWHYYAKPCVTTMPSRVSQLCQAVCHNYAKLYVTTVPSCMSQPCQAVWYKYAL